jgi:hypothetical protein
VGGWVEAWRINAVCSVLPQYIVMFDIDILVTTELVETKKYFAENLNVQPYFFAIKLSIYIDQQLSAEYNLLVHFHSLTIYRIESPFSWTKN